MGRLGFFDADNRLRALSAKGRPLEAIDRLVPWEIFRGDIEAAVLTPDTVPHEADEIGTVVPMAAISDSSCPHLLQDCPVHLKYSPSFN